MQDAGRCVLVPLSPGSCFNEMHGVASWFLVQKRFPPPANLVFLFIVIIGYIRLLDASRRKWLLRFENGFVAVSKLLAVTLGMTGLKNLTLIFLFVHGLTLGQTPVPDLREKRTDSYEKLPPGKIRTEISNFIIEGGNYEKRDSLTKVHLEEIPVKVYTDSCILFKKGPLSVKITSASFDTTNKKLGYFIDNENSSFLLYIQGRPFWGTDGGVPTEIIRQIVVRDGQTQVMLPDSAIKDLFQPNFCSPDNHSGGLYCHTHIYRSKDKRRIYIYMLNSDGAGGYEVTFVLEDKKYKRRIVDYGF
jgi:hypothetical protein